MTHGHGKFLLIVVIEEQGDEYQPMYDQPEREKVGGDFEEEE